MKVPGKKSSILAIVIWIVSFILSFIIPPASQFIWLPDTLLLLGFWPLLFAMKARWLWLVFGLCNMFIAFVLLVALFVPDNALAPYHMVGIKAHMQLYHPYLAWFLVGLLSAIIGLSLLIKSSFVWLFKQIKTIKKTD